MNIPRLITILMGTASFLVPVIVFIKYLADGIVLISPPLISMAMAGLIAIKLALKKDIWDQL